VHSIVVATAVVTSAAATITATVADATSRASTHGDTNAGDGAETAGDAQATGTGTLTRVAAWRRDFVGSFLGGDINMAVSFAADHRAVLIAGDASGGGRASVMRFQFGRPPLVDNRLHIKIFLGWRRHHRCCWASSLFYHPLLWFF